MWIDRNKSYYNILISIHCYTKELSVLSLVSVTQYAMGKILNNQVKIINIFHREDCIAIKNCHLGKLLVPRSTEMKNAQIRLLQIKRPGPAVLRYSSDIGIFIC